MSNIFKIILDFLKNLCYYLKNITKIIQIGVVKINNFNLINYDVDTNYDYSIEKAKEGNKEEIDKMFHQFLPLIKKTSKFNGQYDEDLIQELYFDFLKAIKYYNPNKNIKFITFLTNVINRNKTDYLKFKNNVIDYMENGEYKSKTIYKTSLESKLSRNEEDSNDNLKDILIDEKIDIEKSLIKKELIEKVLEIIDNLQINYKYIFVKYFGLYNSKSLNMKEIGKKLNCTQQEISRKLIKIKKQIRKKLLWEGYSNYIN